MYGIMDLARVKLKDHLAVKDLSRFRQFWCKAYEGQRITVDAPLNTMPVYVRASSPWARMQVLSK